MCTHCRLLATPQCGLDLSRLQAFALSVCSSVQLAMIKRRGRGRKGVVNVGYWNNYIWGHCRRVKLGGLETGRARKVK